MKATRWIWKQRLMGMRHADLVRQRITDTHTHYEVMCLTNVNNNNTIFSCINRSLYGACADTIMSTSNHECQEHRMHKETKQEKWQEITAPTWAQWLLWHAFQFLILCYLVLRLRILTTRDNDVNSNDVWCRQNGNTTYFQQEVNQVYSCSVQK